jgi:hypothetical protein
MSKTYAYKGKQAWEFARFDPAPNNNGIHIRAALGFGKSINRVFSKAEAQLLTQFLVKSGWQSTQNIPSIEDMNFLIQ